MRDPVREDARLPRPRPGDDEKRPLDVEHRLALRGIQVGEELLVRRDGHASMLAATSGDEPATSEGEASVPP